jgi:hypothetical protein
MGVNRSAAVVVAYLVDCLGMNLLAAVQHVRDKRGCILGNSSFRAELVKFSFELPPIDGHPCRLGDVDERERWFALKPKPPTPDPFVFGPPPESWRELPLKVGGRVRVHKCGDEWCEGILMRSDELTGGDEPCHLCVVELDEGGEDSIEIVNGSSPDICAVADFQQP